MKSIKNLFPIALLISIVPFLFYGSPSIAQSIIVIAVSALAGFRYYLDQKEQAVAVYNTYLMLVPEESQSYRQVATWLVDLEHQLKRRGANENG